MMPISVSDPSNGQSSNRRGKLHWSVLLSLFVALICTNMTTAAPSLTNEASLTPLGSVTKELTNQNVTVQAVISSIREPQSARAPYLVSLTESNATLPLVYWSDMQPQLASKVKVGNLIRVTALVNVYRDQLQLRLRSVTALDLVSAAPASAGTTSNATATASPPASAASPTTSPTATVIGAIKADWVDRVVIISGTIATSESIDKAQRLSVQDATGGIPVVLRDKALSGLSPADFQPGRAITVTGPVKLDNGTRTIVPEAAGAVKLAPR